MQAFQPCFGARAYEFYIFGQCMYIVFFNQCQKAQNNSHIV